MFNYNHWLGISKWPNDCVGRSCHQQLDKTKSTPGSSHLLPLSAFIYEACQSMFWWSADDTDVSCPTAENICQATTSCPCTINPHYVYKTVPPVSGAYEVYIDAPHHDGSNDTGYIVVFTVQHPPFLGNSPSPWRPYFLHMVHCFVVKIWKSFWWQQYNKH
jgi:hypothetical protein